ncbi:MAG TPA: hypothetical protein VGX70_18560 [Gemmataceae bacterium]|nr:hypothetical protein [Gemmataceae bacterium]
MSKQRQKKSSATARQKKKPAANGLASKFRSAAVSHLAHIAEALRPLAIRCSELNLDPENVRLHPEKNLEAIMRSLEQFGQDQPLVVQRQA